MLRSALASSGSSSSRGGTPAALPDLPKLLQRRNQALEARRQERADMQVSSARAELVGAVLGSWSKAPKAAREDMEKYLQGECLQGSEGEAVGVQSNENVALALLALQVQWAPPAPTKSACAGVPRPPWRAVTPPAASPPLSPFSGGAAAGRRVQQRGGGGCGGSGLARAVRAPPGHLPRPHPAGRPAEGQVW